MGLKLWIMVSKACHCFAMVKYMFSKRMSAEKKGFIRRFFTEPVEKVSAVTWKLSAFASVVSVALGKLYPGLQLAMISVAGLIINNEAQKSLKKSPA